VVVSVHCCITIVVVHLLNTIVKSTLFVIVSELPRHYYTIIESIMRTLAIVMATCSYGIYSGGRVVITYSLMLLLFRLGCR